MLYLLGYNTIFWKTSLPLWEVITKSPNASLKGQCVGIVYSGKPCNRP